jgi:type II secretory ATPase GspE/PulE/Tfp pilus assembly ATPase PilB-like protein
VLAQRLVRRVCRTCRRPAELGVEALREVAGGTGADVEAVEGQGCEECAQTGYRGRCGIYELLIVTEGIRQLVLKRASADIIREAAVRQGMRTLREDGWEKVRTGVTSVAEVVRVTQEEV